jgi:hypothetical protein
LVQNTTASTSTSTGALIVSGGVGVAKNLYVGSKTVIGAPPASTAYELDISGQMRIYETTGTAAGTSTGSLVLEHGDASGVSSIVFQSKNNVGSDYAYIQYQENAGGTFEKGLLTIGIENDVGSDGASDRISLFAAGGSGFVGVNTTTPQFQLDVSGSGNFTGNLTVTGSIVATVPTTSSYVCDGILNADQTFATGSDAVIQFIDYIDPNNWLASNQFKPTIAGYYHVSFGAWLQNPGVSSNKVNVQMIKNIMESFVKPMKKQKQPALKNSLR